MSSLGDEWVGKARSERQHGILLAEVYRKAVDRFCREVTQDNRKVALLTGTIHMEDIETIVITAQKNFEQSRNQKLRKWLDRLTKSIVYYRNIFDVLAQHHPEYVALAWGAVKFLLVAVTNHENAITSLSRGLALIGEALPRVELATTLYPTDRMLKVVEKLYVCILQYFVRSHDWYCEGTFRHMLHSITRPAELRYEDLLDNIVTLSRTIDQLAISGSQVELRSVKITLQAVLNRLERSETWMQEVKDSIINYQAINSSSLLDTNQKVSDLQFSEMIHIVSTTSSPDPIESLSYGIFMRKRRQMQHKFQIPRFSGARQSCRNFRTPNHGLSLSSKAIFSLASLCKTPLSWSQKSFSATVSQCSGLCRRGYRNRRTGTVLRKMFLCLSWLRH